MTLGAAGDRVSRDTSSLRTALQRELPRAVLLRHELHAAARVSGDEGDTLEQMLSALPVGGVVARIPGHAAIVGYAGDGPVIALRAELDALPLDEATGAPWAATGGAMHACGHDVHMAAAVAVARALRNSGEVPLPLAVLLQPREETYPSGALDVVGSREFATAGISAVVGAHLQPLLPAGEVSCTPGVVNAAADEFTVRFLGVEGHAAYPHLTRDPLVAAGHFITAAQQIVGRNVDPMSPAVLTIGTVRAGSAPNAVAPDAELRGTVRAMSPQTRELLQTRLREVADGIAAAARCRAEVSIAEGEPELRNAAELSAGTRAHLDEWKILSARDIRSCGADDFAYYSAAVPSVMMFVGTDGAGQGLHSRTFLPEDDAVGWVARAMLAGYIAARALYE